MVVDVVVVDVLVVVVLVVVVVVALDVVELAEVEVVEVVVDVLGIHSAKANQKEVRCKGKWLRTVIIITPMLANCSSHAGRRTCIADTLHKSTMSILFSIRCLDCTYTTLTVNWLLGSSVRDGADGREKSSSPHFWCYRRAADHISDCLRCFILFDW